MLAELARRIRLHRAAGGETAVLVGGDGEGEDDEAPERLILGDDCRMQ